jgi:hypothetical protein
MPSMPRRKSCGSTATRMRICGVSWITPARSSTPESARPRRGRRYAAAPLAADHSAPPPPRSDRWGLQPSPSMRAAAPRTLPRAGAAVSTYPPRDPRSLGTPAQRVVAQPQRLSRCVHSVLPREPHCRSPERLGHRRAFRAHLAPMLDLLAEWLDASVGRAGLLASHGAPVVAG